MRQAAAMAATVRRAGPPEALADPAGAEPARRARAAPGSGGAELRGTRRIMAPPALGLGSGQGSGQGAGGATRWSAANR